MKRSKKDMILMSDQGIYVKKCVHFPLARPLSRQQIVNRLHPVVFHPSRVKSFSISHLIDKSKKQDRQCDNLKVTANNIES